MTEIVVTIAYFIAVPFFWYLIEGTMSVKTNLTGYKAIGTAMLVICGLLGALTPLNSAIPLAILGIASMVVGWGAPFIYRLFAGHYDHKVISLFRQ